MSDVITRDPETGLIRPSDLPASSGSIPVVTLAGRSLLNPTSTPVVVVTDAVTVGGNPSAQLQRWTGLAWVAAAPDVLSPAPTNPSAANPDTSGATLAALETEVNQLKALLREQNLMLT